MTVWLMPLEPIDERYTAQWYGWFPEVMEDNDVDFAVINGETIESQLEGKYFLDPISTNVWKNTQLTSLIKRIDRGEVTENDVIFFFDLWTPAVTTLAYIRDMAGIDFDIAGVFHAGSYDPFDLLAQSGAGSWAGQIENGWLSAIDTVFLSTEYHRDLLSSARETENTDVFVTGLPVDISSLIYRRNDWSERKDRVVFTGRQSVEKGWNFVLSLQDMLDIEIVSTLDRDLSKQEYYDFLVNSKAVFAPSKQETFGYGVIEGMALECTPIVPDRLAFENTVPEQFRYESRAEAIEMIETAVETENPEPLPAERLLRYQYDRVIEQMLIHLGEL